MSKHAPLRQLAALLPRHNRTYLSAPTSLSPRDRRTTSASFSHRHPTHARLQPSLTPARHLLFARSRPRPRCRFRHPPRSPPRLTLRAFCARSASQVQRCGPLQRRRRLPRRCSPRRRRDRPHPGGAASQTASRMPAFRRREGRIAEHHCLHLVPPRAQSGPGTAVTFDGAQSLSYYLDAFK